MVLKTPPPIYNFLKNLHIEQNTFSKINNIF